MAGDLLRSLFLVVLDVQGSGTDSGGEDATPQEPTMQLGFLKELEAGGSPMEALTPSPRDPQSGAAPTPTVGGLHFFRALDEDTRGAGAGDSSPAHPPSISVSSADVVETPVSGSKKARSAAGSSRASPTGRVKQGSSRRSQSNVVISSRQSAAPTTSEDGYAVTRISAADFPDSVRGDAENSGDDYRTSDYGADYGGGDGGGSPYAVCVATICVFAVSRARARSSWPCCKKAITASLTLQMTHRKCMIGPAPPKVASTAWPSSRC